MTDPLEIAANIVVAVSIVLAGRNSVHTWWTGMIGCTLFGLLFYRSQLYADVLLQAFFVITSVIGWHQWLRGDHGAPLTVAHANFQKLAWIVPVAIGATAAYGALLHFFTDAYAPFVDSAVLVLSVIAQLLLMQRRIETWPLWLLVDAIAVPLYASRDLHLTALLYAGFFINALVAWRWWWRLSRAP
jgi:nicotinamide mononucleotide transporter